MDRELARRLGLADAPLDADTAAVIDARLAQPLDRDAAIRIALAVNPRMRASLARLDIAASDLAVVLGPLDIDGELKFFGSKSEYELSATQDILGLIAVGSSRAIGHAQLAAARAEATGAALRLVARVEMAFNDFIAAQQDLELATIAFDAADAAALLRERMYDAGNAPAVARARDRDARETARIDITRAEAKVTVRRETLNGLLGLADQRTAWTARGRLEDLPAEAPVLDQLEVTAVSASLDLAAGRARVDAAEARASNTRLRTWLPHLGLGVAVESDHDATGYGVGPAIRLGLPVFDWNIGGRRRANADVRVAAATLAADKVELRAAARAARVTALAAYREGEQLRSVVIPLRQEILDETLKHYNAMDADPFALVTARRQLAEGGYLLVDATRRYWNAMAAVHALERGVLVEAPEVPTPGAGAETAERSSGPVDHDER